MASLFNVYAELICEEDDDAGRKDPHGGTEAKLREFFHVGLAPAHQGPDGDTGTIGELLFGVGFHLFVKFTVYRLLFLARSLRSKLKQKLIVR